MYIKHDALLFKGDQFRGEQISLVTHFSTAIVSKETTGRFKFTELTADKNSVCVVFDNSSITLPFSKERFWEIASAADREGQFADFTQKNWPNLQR